MNRIALLTALALYGGINYWIFLRSWQAIPANPLVRALLIIAFLFASTSFFMAMGFGNRMPLWLTTILENIGAYWVIGLLYFILAVLFFDLLRLSNHFFRFYPDWVYAHYPQVKLVAFLSVIGLFSLFALIGNYRFRNPSVRELYLEVPRGKAPAGDLIIAMASDVHLGNIIRKDRLAKYVELLNRQEADVILFAGDLIDHSMRPVEARRMHEELIKLKAPLGVFAVFGNHEYYGDVQRAAEFYRLSGIRLLRDSALNVADRFLLIGRDDVSQHRRKSLESILADQRPDLPKILLDHNPSHLDDAAKYNVDLQLSGHTHNGQIFPINLLIRKIYALGYGYEKRGKTHYYVSSGLGLWAAPIRIGTRSEVVRIRISMI